MDVRHRLEGLPEAGSIEYESWLAGEPGPIEYDSWCRDPGTVEFDSWRTPREGKRGRRG